MAKKKGRRSANVARKREKRNRDRKSRQKQIAIEKQRRLPRERLEEERFRNFMSQSRELLDEPEFESVHFDFELMYTCVTALLDDYEMLNESTPLTERDALLELRKRSDAIEPLTQSMPERVEHIQEREQAERAWEHFRTEILPNLVTPEFMQELIQVLKTCENRLNLAGNREMAEVAHATRSIFEYVPEKILVFHPLIQSIGIQTLRRLVTKENIIMDKSEDVKSIISNVLEYEDVIDMTEEMTSGFTSLPEIAGSVTKLKTDEDSPYLQIAENQLEHTEVQEKKDVHVPAALSPQPEFEMLSRIRIAKTVDSSKPAELKGKGGVQPRTKDEVLDILARITPEDKQAQKLVRASVLAKWREKGGRQLTDVISEQQEFYEFYVDEVVNLEIANLEMETKLEGKANLNAAETKLLEVLKAENRTHEQQEFYEFYVDEVVNLEIADLETGAKLSATDIEFLKALKAVHAQPPAIQTPTLDEKPRLPDTSASPLASMSGTALPGTDVISEDDSSDVFSPDSLSARALYKNFQGVAIREIFETNSAFMLNEETETQIGFVHVNCIYYITVTDDRLLLQARSESELTIAMNEVESQCESAVLYLAKSINT